MNAEPATPITAVPSLNEVQPQPIIPSAIIGEVGRLLKQSRESQGRSVIDVVRALRIRQVYVDAIEDGRYHDLPAPTYALGFVRSYALLLGLDAPEIMRRFKLETTGFSTRQEMVYPLPNSETKMPSVPLVAIGAVSVLLLWGVWAIFSGGAEAPAPTLPDVPNRMAALVDAQNAQATLTTNPEAAAPAVPVPVPAAEAPQATPAPLDAAPAVLSTNATPAAAVDVAPTAAPAVSQPAPVTAAPASTGTAKIVIRATGESWLQIQDNGKPFITRVMKTGDSFTVPDKQGLTLLTGNAGALEVMVNDKVVPALGPQGAVRRNISLDAQKLIAGTAAPAAAAAQPSAAPAATPAAQ